MKKKPTTKAAKKSRAELRKQLARDLARILANPETPDALYSDITERIIDFETMDYSPLHTAGNIERALEQHARYEAHRKGGAK